MEEKRSIEMTKENREHKYSMEKKLSWKKSRAAKIIVQQKESESEIKKDK